MSNFDSVAIGLIITWLVFRFVFKVDVTRIFVGFIFILIANTWRVGKVILSIGKKNGEYAPPEPRKTPSSAFDIASHEKLQPGEVVVGYNARRPIIANIKSGHTLVCGITGGGKTFLLHSMLVQWYSLGKRFTDNFEVYLIDLKGNVREKVWYWEACVDGYVGGGETDNVKQATQLMQRLAKTGGDPDKHTIIIIDEVVTLTKDNAAAAVLRDLASKFRSTGSLILVNQYAKVAVIDTIIRYNLDRRICFRARELAHIRHAMSDNTIAKNMSPTEPGEFLISDAKSPKIRSGKVRQVKINGPESDISMAINLAMSNLGQSDKRISLYLAACGNLKRGGQLPAVNSIKGEVGLKQKDVMYSYRNYCLARAVQKTQRNTYVLISSFEEGYVALRRYILAGKWQSEPQQSAKVS